MTKWKTLEYFVKLKHFPTLPLRPICIETTTGLNDTADF